MQRNLTIAHKKLKLLNEAADAERNVLLDPKT